MVVAMDDVVPDEPSYCAADEDIRGEMLAGEDAGEADASGEAVGGDLGERTFVFGGNDGCRGPGDHRVRGRERGIRADAGLKEFAVRIVEGGALAEGDRFH